MYLDKRFSELQLKKVEKLLEMGKDLYKIDLHIHTNYSTDGLQTVVQALKKAKEKGIEIVSITDHDSTAAYREILDQKLYRSSEYPIIIPGIEFTVSYPQYNGRCHILKYFYDETNNSFQQNILQNEQAFRNRVVVWFERIRYNETLQFYSQKYGITYSKDDFELFLKKRGNTIPDYPLLMEYLFSILREKGVTVWDIYHKVQEYNANDMCTMIRYKRKQALKRFYEKYHDQEIARNYKKIKPLLAPLDVDDNDYPEFPSSGSLSINEYGQIQITALKNTGMNVFAHPDRNKLDCIDEVLDFIWGIELNAHSDRKTNADILEKAKEQSLFLTRGSDKHSATDEFYEDMGFYIVTRKELARFVEMAYKSLDNK